MNLTTSNRRLLKVAEVLEAIPRTFKQRAKAGVPDFDMSTFFDDYGSQSEGVCGTAACAAGYAGLNPWFRRKGFITDRIKGDVRFNDETGFDACEDFFGLSDEQALALFTPNLGHETPKQVAKNIRKFVAKRTKLTVDE